MDKSVFGTTDHASETGGSSRIGSPAPGFPTTRMRRNRRADWARRMVAENTLSTNDLIWPLFICDGENIRTPVPSMPDVDRLSIDNAVAAAERAVSIGIPVVALFPYTDPDLRNEDGSEGLNPDNLVCTASRAIKQAHPELGIMCDVALDPYTSHGHDGLLDGETILNDETIEVLIEQALIQVDAGCDIIGPSDMMDGRSAPSERHLTKTATPTPCSWPTPQNMPLRSTARSAMPSAVQQHSSATNAPTR